MGKGIIRKIIFPLYLLLPACTGAQPMHSEVNTFFTANADKSVEIFVFDGFKLNPIIRDTELIREKIPVTEGNYFVLFFLKDGYIPEIKVLKAGKENINLGKIRPEKKMDKNMGILAGVVYKPIHGGKVSFRKGIFKLIDKIEIKVVSEKVESYLIRSNDKGIFTVSLIPGKYKVSIGDDKEKIDVIITKAKTTIQNLQKGVMLVD